MKLFGKLLIAAVVLAVLLPFTVLKGKDGKPLMSFSDIKAPALSLPEIPSALKNAELPSANSGKDIVYKWRDKKGELHFTSAPPPKGLEFTVKGYDPGTNLIQAVKIEEEEPEQPEQQTESKNPLDIGNPYSPEKVEKLIKDAQNIQKLLNDRVKKQEAMLN